MTTGPNIIRGCSYGCPTPAHFVDGGCGASRGQQDHGECALRIQKGFQ
jgi:hypothetical protein